MRRQQQRHGACAAYAHQFHQRHGVGREFRPVARGKLLPARGLVPEPAPQGVAGCDLLQLQIYLSPRPSQSSRPEVVDENTGAIVRAGRVIRVSQMDQRAVTALHARSQSASTKFADEGYVGLVRSQHPGEIGVELIVAHARQLLA